MKPETSYCTVAIIDNTEYFQRKGSIYQAPLSNVIMPDGYRCGRFFCNASRWNEYCGLLETIKHELILTHGGF